MARATTQRADRARLAGLALALALEAALVIADVAIPGEVILTSAYLIAPLALALVAGPRVVAATGALSVALALASGLWNGFFLSADHVMRCSIVTLAAGLALLSARARRSAVEARLLTEEARRSADAARERLDVMLGSLAEAVTVHDGAGKTIYANDATVRLLGAHSLDEVLAARPGELSAHFAITQEDGSPVALEDFPGRLAVLGQPAVPMLTKSVELATGREYWLLTKATVVADEHGAPLAVNIIEDVTAAKRTELRQRLLADAGRVLASAREAESALARVARLAVPALGDWCAIDLVDDRGELVRVVLAHADAAKVSHAERLRERHRAARDDDAVHRVLRSGRAELFAQISDEMLRAATIDDEHLELVMALGVRSAVVAPLRAGSRIHGVLSLVTSDSRRTLDAGDLAFVEDLALRVGAAVENVRLYRELARTARTLQDSLLPRRLPEFERFRTATSYRPGGADNDVGGDFYDLFDVDDDVMVLLGDVTGKGVDAAAMTSLVRHTAKAAAMFDGRPAAILRVVDEMLRDEQPFSLVTLVCARLRETAAGAAVELASGGHPLPLLIARDGAVRAVGRTGLVLGAMGGGDWRDERFVLAAGETLLFYTDGATDAPGADERFGEQRLEQVVAGAGDPDAVVARIDRAIELFQGAREGDDRALLAIQYARSAVAAPRR
ncbi:MAG TPA: SpoIIE family protein phosphatase [Solirubrobacteraceae bacterium]|jgi:PAS domain-containing protein|nr:SpoIIE family protein phosphatase [Solirubrobacteraceae bacterium]